MTIQAPLAALRAMTMIRAFETALAGRSDHGFQLLSSGEEAVAVGLSLALAPEDQLLTGGRSIGPALARGLDPGAVMAELLGRTDGINGGRAGRGHMSDPEHGFFGAHAVVGGNISIAAGVALARKQHDQPGIVVVLFGDGACGAGALAETLNIASVWRLPLLFVCNNNGFSVSTRAGDILAPRRLSDLGKPFGMPCASADGMDVEVVFATANEMADYVRSRAGPAFVEFNSLRFASHSTTARETRNKQELAAMKARCPIAAYGRRLAERGELDLQTAASIEEDVARVVAAAVSFAENATRPHPDDVLDHVQ